VVISRLHGPTYFVDRIQDSMRYRPDFQTFSRLAQGVRLVPVFRQLFSDTVTPVTAYSKIRGEWCSFLFESVVGGEKIGRYSFAGAEPFLRVEAYGRRLIRHDDSGVTELESADPLSELQTWLDTYPAAQVPGLPRFCGGAVGYAGYDVVRYVEHLPNAPADDRQLPDLSFGFYSRMIIFDHVNKTVQVVCHADVGNARTEEELRLAYDQACARVDALCDQLQEPDGSLRLTDVLTAETPEPDWTSNFTQAEFEAAVESCREYITAGDIFQVVLSQRLTRETTATPLAIYRALRYVNPSPFMFLLETPEVRLIGSSPEIMVRVQEGEVTVRPLAGTRRRGASEEEDRALAKELLADPKERAEHVMLIDLARNDVGRVAEFGTVELSDVMVVERYSHVMHITSNVTGQLRPGKRALDALRAALPAGTVSGAPKVRAMQIIDEFEPHRRGPYAGAVGYLDFNGNMDTCIALRTLVMQGSTIYLQAGAGIVADSVPHLEYQETLSKARGLLKAIQLAELQLTEPTEGSSTAS